MSALNSAQTAESSWRMAPLANTFGIALVRRPQWRNPALLEVRPQSPPDVLYKRTWQQRPENVADDTRGRILVRRWKNESPAVRGYESAPDHEFAVLTIALRATNAALFVNGRSVHDGKIPAGMVVLTACGLPSAVEFRAPCDLLHLFVPRQRLDKIWGEIVSGGALQPVQSNVMLAEDPAIERLAWLLLHARDCEAGYSGPYIDAIAVAIVSRMLIAGRESELAGRLRQGLVKWRLKRVQALIEEQLSETLSLNDLARCAGLSRMHFAAQFRAATGMRPHEYLVRRRIQRAQEMLLSTTMPLVEVALSVGFQTQAHFTTVFRRLLGETPGRWRQLQRFV